MKNLFKICFISFISTITLFASSEKEVKELVIQANEYCENNGLDECIKVFNNKDPRFTKGELYIFVSKFSGDTLAHGGNTKLVGKNLLNVKSPSGIYPTLEFVKIATGSGSGWVEYKWSHPISKNIADKKAFITRFKNEDIFIGSGYYK